MTLRTSFRWSKNICSVLQRPMPSAPLRRACLASAGESAFARTFIDRISSTHPMNTPKSPEDIFGGTIGWDPSRTSPVLPFNDSRSPSLRVTPPRVIVFPSSSMRRSPRPHTHVLPQPRATTAACDVIPPRAVRMPAAAYMPPTSSGDVSARTRIDLTPSLWSLSTSSVVKATIPVAAPGDAGNPWPSMLSTYVSASSSSNWGWSIVSRFSGVTKFTACSFVTSPSFTRSVAILTAALPDRFPDRVWRRKSLPSWTVNSMSCMSLK
mmetsp:Transcript_6862/g.8504  ORF Transcript_6862/g.8504 Transcript_6862/m.8504 type:complete len:266 (-) Transcript_6862:1177-1974(-)